MKALKDGMRLAVMLAVCMIMVACPEPGTDMGGMQDEFKVALGFTQEMGAVSRAAFTINTDEAVTKVYAKVFNSSRVHLPSTDESGVTELMKSDGKWSATVRLASATSREITFFVWGENASGEHLYSGDGKITVPASTSITVLTAAGYSLRDMGPAGGYIFHDKGNYVDGWRYLEAARAGWSGSTYDPGYIFGHYMRQAGLGLRSTTMYPLRRYM